ncbi:OmpA family protein [Pontibacter sp. KCTC 32443]|uniref:OmpA family protein n=1 Tax=Pontibacter TaxID=323449 RepID=UPI00164D294F|nr:MULTISPECIES: OmpA family protein [Pontibacter]MBC5773234.1 OmpA family protein [Pontibacter sp. KCTC 32443]
MPKQLLVFLLCFFLAIGVYAQKQPLSTTSKKAESLYLKADDYARSRDFTRALELLAEAVEKDPNFAEAYLKASNLNKMMGNKAQSFEQLDKGLKLMPYNPAFANYYFDLAELNFDKGDYKAAKSNYENYLKANTKNSRFITYAKSQIETADYALQAMKEPVQFKSVQLPANINKYPLQYFPSTTADQRYLIFTARNGLRPDQDENIFISEKKEGEWQAPVSISEIINTTANEGAATISGDGKTLVFTACSLPDSFGDCDLYISFRTGNEWSKPKNMGSTVNSKNWDSQPSLSADGRTLYFSSMRGGGIGKEDIWTTTLSDDGSWGKPRNMGEPVNSKGRDLAPFIHVSGSTLYFVSDGHKGLGGLDVFMTDLASRQQWQTPKNLGYPLNTHADESSLYITPDNKLGFYARSMSTDDGTTTVQLYSLDVPAVWQTKAKSTYAQGRVYHADTKKPLAATVQLYDIEADSLVQQVRSDKVSGEYTVVLTEGKQYALYVSASQFMMNSLNFDYTSRKNLTPVALDVYLKPIKTGSAVVLNNLFFPSAKYNLEKKSQTELNKLINFMRQNQNLKIEITGHTDDVGSDAANQLLSEKRAKAVVDYLVAKGVSGNRIRYKGLGESKPVKANTSEENRQLNRRIEMQVL